MAQSETSLGTPTAALDEQDRISILQLLTLSPTERLQYLLDELEFDEATSSQA